MNRAIRRSLVRRAERRLDDNERSIARIETMLRLSAEHGEEPPAWLVLRLEKKRHEQAQLRQFWDHAKNDTR